MTASQPDFDIGPSLPIEVCCHYPECVRCCPNGCRIMARLGIEQMVRNGSYSDARAFWEIHFGGAAHVEQTGHREKQGR